MEDNKNDIALSVKKLALKKKSVKKISIFFFGLFVFQCQVFGQFETIKDSIVQVYGVVTSGEGKELLLLPNVNVQVLRTNRGTISNQQGVYSIVLYKGDTLKFTCIGFAPKLMVIPKDIKGNLLSAVQVMQQDTITLPVAIITPRPSREQFERDFIAFKDVNTALIQSAQHNAQSLERALLMSALSPDAKEAFGQNIRNSLQQPVTGGVAPGVNLLQVLNPSAWKQFIKSWKSGEFK